MMNRFGLSRCDAINNRDSVVVSTKGIFASMFWLVVTVAILVSFAITPCFSEEHPKVTKDLPKVDNLFKKGDSAKAITMLEKMISRYPTDPRPAARLASYYVESKLYNDAINYAQKAYAIDASNETVVQVLCDSYQGIGQMNIQFRQFDQAKEAYDSMYKLCPTAENRERIVYLYSRIIENALQQKDLTVAIDGFKQIIEFEPDNHELYQKLARLYLTNNQKDEARELLKKGVILFPGQPMLAQALAAFYFQDKNYQDAVQLFDEVLAKDPSNFQIAMYDAYAKQGIAHEKFEQIKTEGKLPKPELTPGTTSKSKAAYAKEVEDKKLELIQLKQTIYQPTIEAFSRAIELDQKGENPKLIINLAVLQGFIGNEELMKATYHRAAMVYKTHIDENPEDVEALYYYGFCLSNAAMDYENAIIALRKVVLLDSAKTHPTALMYIGEILVELKRYEEAKATFQEFIRDNADNNAVRRAESWIEFIDAIMTGTPLGQKPQRLEISEPIIDLGADDSQGLTLDE